MDGYHFTNLQPLLSSFPLIFLLPRSVSVYHYANLKPIVRSSVMRCSSMPAGSPRFRVGRTDRRTDGERYPSPERLIVRRNKALGFGISEREKETEREKLLNNGEAAEPTQLKNKAKEEKRRTLKEIFRRTYERVDLPTIYLPQSFGENRFHPLTIPLLSNRFHDDSLHLVGVVREDCCWLN